MHIIKRPRWAVPERDVTPEHVFLNRRQILAGMATAGLLGADALAGRQAHASDTSTSMYYPAPRNEKFTGGRPLTPMETASTYNNFYEFGSHKQIAQASQALQTDPWTLTVDGLVRSPQKFDIEGLLKMIDIEERIYRLRCVEAWAMTVPWTGFPLSDLIKLVEPRANARYVRFETFLDPEVAPGQRAVWYPWPYVEGLTIEEAANDLTFMVTGVYGRPLMKQFGAPIRLIVPWKYGFKSAKSLVRISFTSEQPETFWEQIQPSEYGFWANVNPEVPHPRWSQETERLLHTGERVPTQIYNGYGPEVVDLYRGNNSDRLFV